jgi:tetratricopeptide (TPR) repeat protein
VKYGFLLVLACLVPPAQTQDPAGGPPEKIALQKAYEALRGKRYPEAIDSFLLAVQAAPGRADIRKELGYTYLKAGETEAARAVFEQALALDPQDLQTSLELAFLCYETGREARALELFERVRQFGDAAARKTAEEGFHTVDRALRAAIGRWSAAVAQDPNNRAARLELASHLEKHREPARAAEEYLAAWRLPPRREETLLDLARARREAGDEEGAAGAWLAASRSKQTRIAERARAKLPHRHPYANEYRQALHLDPSNTELRRDLAFLWLAVDRKAEAVREFEIIVREDPGDMLSCAQLGLLYLELQDTARALPLLEKVAAGPDAELAARAKRALGKTPGPPPRSKREQARPHKALGEKSLAFSYLNDALREFQIAHEIDPDDAETALRLGVVHNILRRDVEAMRWFQEAMKSPDPAIAAEARRSYHNLAPQWERFQTSVWALPMFSTRFHDGFQYGQIKTEMRLGGLPLRPYISLRLAGDWKRKTGEPLPQFLSESSLIAAAGVRTPVWRGFILWGEAGEAVSYLHQPPPGTPRAGPDYRGGAAWSRSLGATLGGGRPGAFAELNVDGVFLSRYGNDLISYWQMRHGYRLPQWRAWRSQIFWNSNVVFDRQRQYYANFAEFGPGYRFRVPGMHPPLDVTISGLRGVYLVNEFNPHRPNYYDLRIGLWYSAFR